MQKKSKKHFSEMWNVKTVLNSGYYYFFLPGDFSFTVLTELTER